MNIYLTDTETGYRFTFPMLPEKIDVASEAAFRSYDVMGRGEIKFPYGESLLAVSWEGKLPGAKRDGEYIILDKSPKAVQSWWSEVRTEKRKLKLMITGTPINCDVYLENFEMTYEGGFGDYDYSISFVQAKELKIKTEAKKLKLKKKAATEDDSTGKLKLKRKSTGTTSSPPAPSRPSKPAAKTYTVKVGDSLWGIAQKVLGDGSRYPELYAANQAKMDALNQKKGVNQKYMIWGGTTLTIP